MRRPPARRNRRPDCLPKRQWRRQSIRQSQPRRSPLLRLRGHNFLTPKPCARARLGRTGRRSRRGPRPPPRTWAWRLKRATLQGRPPSPRRRPSSRRARSHSPSTIRPRSGQRRLPPMVWSPGPKPPRPAPRRRRRIGRFSLGRPRNPGRRQRQRPKHPRLRPSLSRTRRRRPIPWWPRRLRPNCRRTSRLRPGCRGPRRRLVGQQAVNLLATAFGEHVCRSPDRAAGPLATPKSETESRGSMPICGANMRRTQRRGDRPAKGASKWRDSGECNQDDILNT
jgi:hypothetical protein